MSAKLGKRTVTPRFLAPVSQINLEKYNVSAISGRFCAPSALGDPTNNQAYFVAISASLKGIDFSDVEVEWVRLLR